MKEKELEARLSVIEKILNLNSEVGSKIMAKSCNSVVKRNTVDPKEMPEGRIAYVGNYVNEDGGQYSFGVDNNEIKFTLNNVDNVEMSKFMEAFSRPERVEILRLLLKKSRTANELMRILSYNTTGKLYHHLSKMEDLGILTKTNEFYSIKPKKVGACLLIFTAVNKVLRKD